MPIGCKFIAPATSSTYIDKIAGTSPSVLYHTGALSPLRSRCERFLGKCVRFRERFFLEMDELLLICTGVGDAMVCPVVILAPR